MSKFYKPSEMKSKTAQFKADIKEINELTEALRKEAEIGNKDGVKKLEDENNAKVKLMSLKLEVEKQELEKMMHEGVNLELNAAGREIAGGSYYLTLRKREAF